MWLLVGNPCSPSLLARVNVARGLRSIVGVIPTARYARQKRFNLQSYKCVQSALIPLSEKWHQIFSQVLLAPSTTSHVGCSITAVLYLVQEQSAYSIWSRMSVFARQWNIHKASVPRVFVAASHKRTNPQTFAIRDTLLAHEYHARSIEVGVVQTAALHHRYPFATLNIVCFEQPLPVFACIQNMLQVHVLREPECLGISKQHALRDWEPILCRS